jgi:hypothetical protein
MITNLCLSGSHAKPEWKCNSWRRGVILFVTLLSPSLLNLSHAAAGPGSHAIRPCTAILPCECMTMAAPAVQPMPVSATTEDVVRIDEDWELVITEPDPNVAAPQIQTVMSPFQSLDGFFICFLVNHRNNPESAVGGLEVQFWYGESQLGARRLEREEFHHSNETVTWTQRLMIKGLSASPYLCFRVVNGQSESFGDFGGSEPLHMNIDTTQTNLSGYSSSFSVANSGVFFSSNRVARLVLKAVRGYSSDSTLIYEENTPVVVFDGEVQ